WLPAARLADPRLRLAGQSVPIDPPEGARARPSRHGRGVPAFPGPVAQTVAGCAAGDRAGTVSGPGMARRARSSGSRRTRAPARRFLGAQELTRALGEAGVVQPGIADSYLGRALLLLADPTLAAPWETLMSLGGVTKIRKITGREFPVWVDLPAHQPALLESP